MTKYDQIHEFIINGTLLKLPHYQAALKELEAMSIEIDESANEHVFAEMETVLNAIQELVQFEKSAKEVELFKSINNIDQKLQRYIDYKNGYFIELGANDGIVQSNTYFLEFGRDWNGILIEPILHKYLECKKNRSKGNFIYCCACTSFEYNKNYVTLHYSNLMTTPQSVESDIENPKEQALLGEKFLGKGEHSVEFMAPARTMTSILIESGAPKIIDFLSLDVEGGEIEVLKGIDFKLYQFKFILVESRDFKVIENFMISNGFEFVEALSHHDYLFKNRSAP